MQQITTNISEFDDPKPQAIFVVVDHNNYLGAGVAFTSHEVALNLQDILTNVFFKYCAPCKFYQQSDCPGGENYLFSKDIQSVDATTPAGKTIRMASKKRQCLAAATNNLSLPKKISNSQVLVKLPSYMIWYDYNMSYHKWLIFQEPNPKNLDDYWKVFPFPFSNVFAEGHICTGTIQFSSRDLASLRKGLFSARYNDHLTRFFSDHYKTIGQYAKAMTQASDQIKFLKSYTKSKYCADLRKSPYMSSSSAPKLAYILPPNYDVVKRLDNSKVILTDLEGATFELKRDGEIVNYVY